LLHNPAYRGGAEESLIELARGLVSRDHVVHVGLMGDRAGIAETLAAHGAAVEHLPSIAFGQRDVGGFVALQRPLAELVRGADVVHANNLTTAKYAAPVTRALGKPLVAHVRDVPAPDPLTRVLLAGVQRFVAISHFIAAALPREARGRTRVVYNAVGVGRLPARSPGRPLRLLTPTALLPHKRVKAVIEAAQQLPNVTWTVRGPSPDPLHARALRGALQQRGLAERVHLREPTADREALYAEADVVVSTAHDEPFGRTVIEAYAQGLPVVAFDSGAMPELVRDGVTGRLIRDGDVGALASALAALAAEPQRLIELGRAGHSFAQHHFDVERMLSAIEETHAEVI
jgi:glycosyltransferase involved in cell wall biosynthesis